jgi:DNA-binding transcriptional LysR family regulator
MALDPDDLVDLALYARVVQHRSFSSAARDLHIAKSAVSRRISSLESRLGLQLLRRTSRKLELTPDGERFAEHCQQMVASARAAKEAVVQSGTALRGRIRISAPVTFSQMHLARAIAAFQIEHPEVEVELSAADHYVDVVGARFDLVIRIGRLGDASYVARRIATDRLVVVGAPSYLSRAGRPKTPPDLAAHNCLHYEHLALAAEWSFRGETPRVRGNFSATDGTVLRQAVVAGLGLVVIPFFMVAADVEAGRLELVLEGARKAEIGLFAVTSAGRGQPLRVRALVDHLVATFAAPDWRLGASGAPVAAKRVARSRR